MIRGRHFYHVYAGGAWALPLQEHSKAVLAAGLKLRMVVGIVGPARDRYVVRTLLPSLFPFAPGMDVIEADEGYEEVTLRPLQRWCQANPGSAVLYAHDKGALDDSEWNGIWRRSMTHHVVGGWQRCDEHLREGVDLVGCHWVEPDNRPNGFFAGNFWWASADYVAGLKELKVIERHDCEDWIGSGSPDRVVDLLPGYPDTSLCGPYGRV